VGIINDGPKTGWIEGTSIFLAVAIITVVTTTNNYAKQKQFLKLYLCLNGNQTVNVIRNGNKIEIPSSDIVVGDLILIEQGMELPADAILIKGQGVSCNEGSITGESKIMEKKAITEGNNNIEVDSILTGSTFVNEGSGVAMVICVGENSQKGMIEKSLDIEDKPTPLQNKLESIAARVGNIGMAVAILTVLVMTFKLIYTEYILKNCSESKDPNCKEMDYISLFQEFVRYLIVGVTIIVVAIPEGLPLAVTISLAYSVSKMQKGNCLVR
jgi:P-type E1-E2 ATPase